MAFADEPRAEDDVGLVVDDGLDQLGILLGLVLEIGVLDDDDVAGGVLGSQCERSPLPWFLSWKTTFKSPSPFFSKSRRISRVPSREQSSTTMICFLIGTARAASRFVDRCPFR